MESRLPMAADLALPGIELPPVEAPLLDGDLFLPGSISGRVFATLPVGASPSPHGAGIGGVRLELIAPDGRVIAETRTDEQGSYDFPALAPGEYGVRETQPAGWFDGPEQLGAGGPWIETGDWIKVIVVLPGAELGGYDFAEVATSGEPLPPGTSIGGPQQPPLSVGGSLTTLSGLAASEVQTTIAPEAIVREEGEAALGLTRSTPPTSLAQRRAERLFGSGGMLLEDEQEIDFDAALGESFDALAMMLEWLSEAERPAIGPHQPGATAASDERPTSAAGDAAAPMPADKVEPTPGRRVDGSHQLAGKPAA
jgi:hypothetical protein